MENKKEKFKGKKPEEYLTGNNNSKIPVKDASKVKNPGLIPAIVQDYSSGEVLMLAYMSSQSFKKSIKTGTTWFWSRSRNRLWNKGASSGNKQVIKEIRYDCDGDALLIKVQQTGAACHTGNKSCFFRIAENDTLTSLDDKLVFKNVTPDASGILQELYFVICERVKQKDEKSYTYSLHQSGIDEILKKLGEESIEIILSAKHQTKKRIVCEIADMLYHLLVLMSERKIKLEEVYSELIARRR